MSSALGVLAAVSLAMPACGPTRRSADPASRPAPRTPAHTAASPAVASSRQPTAVVFADPTPRRAGDTPTPVRFERASGSLTQPDASLKGTPTAVPATPPSQHPRSPASAAEPALALAEAALGLVPIPGVRLTDRPSGAGHPPVSPAETPWWLATPEPTPGRLRLVARAEARTLAAARASAVDAARAELAKRRGTPTGNAPGSTPAEPTIERTRAEQRPDGSFEAIVLASVPD